MACCVASMSLLLGCGIVRRSPIHSCCPLFSPQPLPLLPFPFPPLILAPLSLPLLLFSPSRRGHQHRHQRSMNVVWPTLCLHVGSSVCSSVSSLVRFSVRSIRPPVCVSVYLFVSFKVISTLVLFPSGWQSVRSPICASLFVYEISYFFTRPLAHPSVSVSLPPSIH